MKKLYLLAIAIITLILLSTQVFAVSFSDLKENHWAYEPITEMASRGILKGYPDGTFLPDKSVTRAEFAKILVLALEVNNSETAKLDIKDVSKEHWAYDYIQTASKYLPAYKNSNGDLEYLPNDGAIREDVVTAIVMASGLENSKYDLSTLNKFSDSSQISENLNKYVAIAVENGLIQGHSNGAFEPKGYLTRAQIAQIIKNVEKMKEASTVTENEKNVFEIVYNTQTLKIDLGKNWEKYQYTSTNGDKKVYTPTERYLSYTETMKYDYDKTTKESKSNSFNVFKGKKEITFKVMLKSDVNEYTTLKIKNPFYVSKTADEAYVEKSTGKNSVKEVVNTLNKVKSVEYKIDNDNWISDSISKNATTVQLIIDVERYNDNKMHTLNIKITDEYDNIWQDETNFKLNLEETDENETEITDQTKEITETKTETKEPTKEVTETKKETEEPTKEVTETKTETKEPTKEITETKKETEESTKEVTETKKETEEPTKEVTETKTETTKQEKEDLEFLQIAKDLITALSTQEYTYNTLADIPNYDPYTHKLNGEKTIDATSYISGAIKAYGVAHDISELKNIQRFTSDSMCNFAKSIVNGATDGAKKYFQVVWIRENQNMNHPDDSTPSLAELQEMMELGDIMIFYAGHRSNSFGYQNCCGRDGKGAHHANIFEGKWNGSKASVYSCGSTPKNTDGEPTWTNLSDAYNGNTRQTLFAIIRLKTTD